MTTTTLPLASLSSSLSSSSSSPSLSPSTLSFAASNSFTRLHNKFIGLNQKLFNGPQVHTPFKLKERYAAVVVMASADVNGTGPVLEPPSESEDESMAALEDLYLEPKLQLKLEQRMRMKVDKKIRLRRKKLLRKRGMRKIGRWPPSKLKKNKNV